MKVFFRIRRKPGEPRAWARLIVGLVGIFDGAIMVASAGMIGSRLGSLVSIWFWKRALTETLEVPREELPTAPESRPSRPDGAGR